MNGKVVVRNHIIEKPSNFIISQVIKPGQFIGAKSIDSGMTLQPFLMPIVYSHRCDLFKMTAAQFRKLWQLSITQEKEI
jgi:hypothetical protein